MTVSILIVSFNVCYFLEHCLLSLRESVSAANASLPDFAAEIIVTDNASTDETMTLLPPKFPEVRFIDAGENLGFGKANNRMLAEVKSRFVVFLNPDTIVPGDYFTKQLAFLSGRPSAGACGIRMIDGTGNYLPESKRGFPGIWNAFTKMSGLTSLFPRSRWLAGYYLGHLNAQSNHVVPVLSGASMLIPRQVLEATGGFDEQFFMYAEDIDLSYRIVQAGYTNYYLADSTIIHFKGESTRKDQIYVERFYGAMILFVRKHFKGAGASLYVKVLELLIRARIATSPKKVLRPAGGHRIISRLPLQPHGDPVACAQLEQALQQRPTAGSEDEPRRRVYCIGKTFTYGMLIKALEDRRDLPALIYHPHAAAIVGSHSKNDQGIVFLLPDSGSFR